MTIACCRTGFSLRSKQAANAGVMCQGSYGYIERDGTNFGKGMGRFVGEQP